MTASLPNVDDGSFEAEVLRAQVPTLVDFHAVWCAPCRVLVPHLTAIAQAHHGHLRVVKLDVDGSPAVAERYGVRNMPTLLLFVRGQVVGQLVGAVPRARIEALLSGAIPQSCTTLVNSSRLIGLTR